MRARAVAWPPRVNVGDRCELGEGEALCTGVVVAWGKPASRAVVVAWDPTPEDPRGATVAHLADALRPARPVDRPLPIPAYLKIRGRFAYTIRQITRDKALWTSEPFTAASWSECWRAIVAGFLFGEPRWAEDRDGLILGGLDGQGNRYADGNVGNLESLRRYAL